MLNEQQMINKVNRIISQSGLGPEYKVYKIRATSWGIIAYWLPQNPALDIAGSGPYLCHKNGIVKEFNEVAHRNRLNALDPNSFMQIIECFVREATTINR
jgi:hypothetical protein